mmetsp:Transcript_63826/g.113246  ORF Transcript_63826/g.113246 Transcript_63826/m.113246 type:complete len:366 (-) Transcript_63826:11-1108(-)
MSVMVHVGSLGGEVCKVAAFLDWTAHELKAAIERASGIAIHQQQLLFDSTELKDLDLLGARLTGEADAHITLIRRAPEQAEWILRVSNDFKALRSAPEHIKADDQVVRAAIKNHGCALEHAARELRGDRMFVLASAQQSSAALAALAHVAPELRDDAGFWMAAMRSDLSGDVLKFVPEEIKANDREMVLVAVQQNWRSLEYVPQKFLDDREVINVAAFQNLEALKFVNARAGLEAGMPMSMLGACEGRGSEFGSKIVFSQELEAAGGGYNKALERRNSRRSSSAHKAGGGFRMPLPQSAGTAIRTKPVLPHPQSSCGRPNSVPVKRSQSAHGYSNNPAPAVEAFRVVAVEGRIRSNPATRTPRQS